MSLCCNAVKSILLGPLQDIADEHFKTENAWPRPTCISLVCQSQSVVIFLYWGGRCLYASQKFGIQMCIRPRQQTLSRCEILLLPMHQFQYIWLAVTWTHCNIVAYIIVHFTTTNTVSANANLINKRGLLPFWNIGSLPILADNRLLVWVLKHLMLYLNTSHVSSNTKPYLNTKSRSTLAQTVVHSSRRKGS